jgi:hypothetical protein
MYEIVLGRVSAASERSRNAAADVSEEDERSDSTEQCRSYETNSSQLVKKYSVFWSI